MSTTSYVSQASAFATEQPAAIDMERNATREKVIRLLVEGMPGRAQYELVRSVQRQGRMAGIGDHPIQPVCPCGGRCRP